MCAAARSGAARSSEGWTPASRGRRGSILPDPSTPKTARRGRAVLRLRWRRFCAWSVPSKKIWYPLADEAGGGEMGEKDEKAAMTQRMEADPMPSGTPLFEIASKGHPPASARQNLKRRGAALRSYSDWPALRMRLS